MTRYGKSSHNKIYVLHNTCTYVNFYTLAIQLHNLHGYAISCVIQADYSFVVLS